MAKCIQLRRLKMLFLQILAFWTQNWPIAQFFLTKQLKVISPFSHKIVIFSKFWCRNGFFDSFPFQKCIRLHTLQLGLKFKSFGTIYSSKISELTPTFKNMLLVGSIVTPNEETWTMKKAQDTWCSMEKTNKKCPFLQRSDAWFNKLHRPVLLVSEQNTVFPRKKKWMSNTGL